ncbi:MAG: hypothetical protein Q8K98_12545 [Bacteroidota bacterium]|nr:hypothetical protein [Bacteroidota bacterium]
MNDLTKETDKIYLKEWVEKYCPTLIKHFSPSKSDWKKVIIPKFIRRNNARDEAIQRDEFYPAETCLYDLIEFAEKGDAHHLKMLNHIEELSQKLVSILKSELISKMRKQLYSLFTNFDDFESEYLHKLAEMETVLFVKNITNCEIIDIEYKVSKNRKSPDFSIRFKDSKSGEEKIFHIEVLNIWVKYEEVENAFTFRNFIDYRVAQKRIKEQQVFNELGKQGVSILPVLWFISDTEEKNIDIKTILKVESYFKESPTCKYQSPCCCLLQGYKNDELHFVFNSIASHLEFINKDIHR